MNRSKIEWCDHTLNIITGCRHGCEYCYARKISQRFCGNVKLNKTMKDKYREDEEDTFWTSHSLEKTESRSYIRLVLNLRFTGTV